MMAPSSSGLGRLVLIQKIAGSTPAGVTIKWNLWASYGVATKLKEFGGIIKFSPLVSPNGIIELETPARAVFIYSLGRWL